MRTGDHIVAAVVILWLTLGILWVILLRWFSRG